MEAHISHIYASYVIDPQVYGLDASIWKTVSGSPSVTSNKYRLNTAEILSYSQFKYGEFEFNVTVPVAPTAADNRVFGLLSKALGNRSRITFTFNTSGELRAQVYSKLGVALFSELIPWNTAWSNTATLFRIGWTRGAVVFTVALADGTQSYSTTYNAGMNPITGSLNIDVLNGNADNMDVASVAVIHSHPSLPLNGGSSISAIIPGTGATNLGKAEDAAHSSGDTGVFVLAKRTDTPTNSAGTDGDYSAINNDSLGHLWVREGYAPTAEDNTNSVIAMVRRAVAVSTYAPTAVQSNSFTTTNVKASAGNVYGFSVINTSGSDRYLQFHNTATTPAGGATAAFKFLVPAGSMLVLSENDWGGPLTFTTGIAPANSTTAATYTAGTAGDLLLDLWYK